MNGKTFYFKQLVFMNIKRRRIAYSHIKFEKKKKQLRQWTTKTGFIKISWMLANFNYYLRNSRLVYFHYHIYHILDDLWSWIYVILKEIIATNLLFSITELVHQYYINQDLLCFNTSIKQGRSWEYECAQHIHERMWANIIIKRSTNFCFSGQGTIHSQNH